MNNTKETLYLYKIIDNISNNFESINNIKYKKQFLAKILTLPNEKLRKVINYIFDAENKIKENNKKTQYKILIEENRFMKKIINHNSFLK